MCMLFISRPAASSTRAPQAQTTLQAHTPQAAHHKQPKSPASTLFCATSSSGRTDYLHRRRLAASLPLCTSSPPPGSPARPRGGRSNSSSSSSSKMPKVTRKDTAGPLQEVSAMAVDDEQLPVKPNFSALSAKERAGKVEFWRIPVPRNRMTPLKTAWLSLYQPITENLKLDMRMNLKTRKVEIKTTAKTTSPDVLQKAADFVQAFILGFEVRDAIALLRLDDLYVEAFEVKDVKTLRGEHLSRAIGRLAGKSGKTKFTIENATKTRIVLADTKIHILGSFQNIKVARDALCSLILGSPPGKVYSKLRSVCSRLNDS